MLTYRSNELNGERRMSWAAKYRPRRFEDVLGQPGAVSTLAKLVHEPAAGSVVLHGPTGAGKTTLARIYAQARMCDAPLASGSPCLRCETCTLVERGHQRELRLYQPNMQNAEELQRIVDEIQLYAPMSARRRVFLFDEAAKLGTRLETLYGELEEPSHGSTYIFTLLDLSFLPEPAQGRLIKVEVNAASADANVENLSRVCRAEELEYDPEALLLLAEASRSFRECVQNLEAVARHGPVTTDAVHALVVAARTRWVVKYFDALARADLPSQLEAFAKSELTAPEQLAALQTLLADLKLKELGPVRSPQAQRLTLLSPSERERVTAFAHELARQSGQDLASLWDGVMGFWANLPASVTEASLRLHQLRFHDLVHGAVSPATTPQSLPVRTTTGAMLCRPSRRASATFRTALTERGAFLDFDEARRLYEAASFSLQRYWAPFNCQIEITWQVDGVSSASRAEEFLRRLGMRLAEWGVAESNGFARISLSESADTFERTVIVGHVPERHSARLETWMLRQAASSRWKADFQLETRTPAAWTHQLERHWDLMRRLWRGLDPSICVDDSQALIDLLGVPPRKRRAAGVVEGRRFTASAPLGAVAQATAIDHGLRFYSAFRQQTWDTIFNGHERAVHEAFCAESAARVQEAARFAELAGASAALATAARARAAKRRSEVLSTTAAPPASIPHANETQPS